MSLHGSAAAWKFRGGGLLCDRPVIMGIVNVTRDSFHDGGRHAAPGAAIGHARRLRDAGADLVDVGGESTRPGADPVEPAEQVERIAPVIEALASDGAVVSVDTRSAVVAEAAVAAGAAIVNDVSGCIDPGMPEFVARSGAGYVLTHSRGVPKTMQDDPRYGDVVAEIVGWFDEKLDSFRAAGIRESAVVIDYGIGFGKRPEDNLELIRSTGSFLRFGRPILLGASRKSFLAAAGAGETPAERLEGSLAAAVAGYLAGARIFRVHDVAETRRALAAAEAIAVGIGRKRNAGREERVSAC